LNRSSLVVMVLVYLFPPPPRRRIKKAGRRSCLEEDPELVFPVGNTGPARLQIEKARAVCHRCEIAQTCLNWAAPSRQQDGAWGGQSDDERRALERRNAPASRQLS
jgi:WhiB family redox-sensing transcriptional regulator